MEKLSDLALDLVYSTAEPDKQIKNTFDDLFCLYDKVLPDENCMAHLLADKGLTQDAVGRTMKLLEFSSRLREQNRNYIRGPEDVNVLMKAIAGSECENLYVICIDERGAVRRMHLAARGTVNRLACPAADVISAVLKKRVRRFIMAHNHPSGDAAPSEEDLIFTRRISEAANLLGIELIDHLVVTEKNFFSFRREGLL